MFSCVKVSRSGAIGGLRYLKCAMSYAAVFYYALIYEKMNEAKRIITNFLILGNYSHLQKMGENGQLKFFISCFLHQNCLGFLFSAACSAISSMRFCRVSGRLASTMDVNIIFLTVLLRLKK